MTQEFQEHWLSAYLDDELSPQERALVEQRLQADPAARELLEDLRRVRGAVATLPKWPGEFKFDPTGLSLDSDDPAELANEAKSDVPQSMVETQSQRPPVRRLPSPGTHEDRGAWRVLAVSAASGILLLLSFAYLWQQYGSSQLAMQGGDKTDNALAKGVAPGAAVQAEPTAEIEATQPAARLMRSGSLPAPAAEQLEQLAPQMFGKEDAASRSAASDAPIGELAFGGVGGAGSVNAFGGGGGGLPPPAPAAQSIPAPEAPAVEQAFPPDPTPVLGFDAPSTNALALGGTGISQNKDQPSDKAAGKLNANSAEPIFICARSDAWAEADVKAAMTTVSNFVPLAWQSALGMQQPSDLTNGPGASFALTEARGRGQPDMLEREPVQAPADAPPVADAPQPADTPQTMPAAPIITGLLEDSTANQWFNELQAIQPLSPLLLSSRGERDSSYRFYTENTRGAQPNDSASNSVDMATGNPEQPKGTLMLFVSQAEAEKILAAVQKPQADRSLRYWRVVPSSDSPATANDPNARVILVLSQPSGG